MRFQKISISITIVLSLLLLLVINSCDKNELKGVPLTNDFRILQVKVDDKVISSGVEEVSVLAVLEIVFSHGMNTTAVEGALSVSPNIDYTVSYSGNNSIATITFTNPLSYETTYSVSLPAGTYGSGGEASIENFSFDFTTAAFEPPGITLSSSSASFFEGEQITVTATIARAILEEVSMDLVFSGSAEGMGTDYMASATSITIPSGETSGTIELTGLNDAELEGEETITITLENLVNAEEVSPQQLDLTLGDSPPAIEFKGVMSLKIGGTATNGRAVHLRVLEDIPDLSRYGVGIANNGGGSDGREIDFPAISVTTGEDILLVRDVDVAGLTTYFGDCYNDFEHVVETGGLNFNGDDPFELYIDTIVIETYGDVELDGTDLEWEYTGSWAYKFGENWEYGQVDCAEGAATDQEAACRYPFCSPLQLQGVLALLWDGSGTNGGKAVHVRANRAIADLSQYGLGVANNGGGTDGLEYNFPVTAVNEGDHILVAREPQTLAPYFGACYDGYAMVFQADEMNQNGDDAIELFDGMDVIETFGDADVDGTGQPWEYAGSWGYKSGGVWVYGGVDCAAGSTSTQTSACVYGFCE